MKEYSISEIHRLMEQGGLSAVQLVEEYLEEIEKIDRTGPDLNAIITVNEHALEEAKELDSFFATKGRKGPLHGIPMLIKDNIDTVMMPTSAGSIAIIKYAGKVKRDAFIVTQLKNAGAIILGKTNLSEMANFRGRRSTSGWSSFGGRTRNPYILNRNPSGSSSGSAVAVAANLCTVAIGTETDGSIISPSHANGIVGIKPSIGLVSRTGIVPIAASQDTAGPMARTVRDAATVLEVLVASDENDLVTKEGSEVDTNYCDTLDEDALMGARIGVLRKNFGFHKDVDAELTKALSVLKSRGATLIDPVEMQYPENWGSQELNVLLYEYKDGLNRYFSTREGGEIHGIDDLIRFNNELKSQTMPFFGQEHVETAAEKGDLSETEYLEAVKAYDEFRSNLTSLLESHELDAIVAPSGGPAWVTDLVNGDSFGGGSSQFAAVSGFCSVTVPAGYVHGLPIGISFIGGRFQEGTILPLAYAFEQASKIRQPPEFKLSFED